METMILNHLLICSFTDAPKNVLLETSGTKACQGDVISINCSADANPSVTSYELLENDTVILDTSGRWSKTLTTGGVFIYKCVANNSVGTQQSSSVNVNVNGKGNENRLSLKGGRGLGAGTRGRGDVGRGDSGTRGRGTRGRGDVGREDSGTRGRGTRGRRTRGLGDVSTWGLGDVVTRDWAT